MAKLIEAVTTGTLSYSATSYVTLDYADGYFGDTLEGMWWLKQDEAEREAALVSATNSIEGLLTGQDADKYDSITTAARPKGQPLQFPRSWDRNGSGTLVVPSEVKDGQCLLALHLLRLYHGYGGAIDAEDMRRINAASSSQDGVSVSMDATPPTTWPQEVQRRIFPFWNRNGDTTEGPSSERRWTRGWVAS